MSYLIILIITNEECGYVLILLFVYVIRVVTIVAKNVFLKLFFRLDEKYPFISVYLVKSVISRKIFSFIDMNMITKY